MKIFLIISKSEHIKIKIIKKRKTLLYKFIPSI